MVKNSNPKMYYLLTLLISIIILLFDGYIGAIEFQKNRASRINALIELGRNYSITLDHEVMVQETKIEMLGAELQSNLEGGEVHINMGVNNLIPTDDPAGYTLSIPKGKTENQVGNLTGLGEIPLPATPLGAEISTALSLSSLFEHTLQGSYQPWVYYTSANRFIYMYPRVAPEDFFFSDALYKKEFYTVATPTQDPERNVVWSPLYDDAAGAGMMVTISKPIYTNDKFRGVLSIDMSLRGLNWVLESTLQSIATPYLIDSQGNLIAGSGELPANLDVKTFESEKLFDYKNRTLMIFPLSEVNWYILLDIDKKEFTLSVIKDSLPVGFVLLFIFFALILFIIVSHNMRSARFMATHDSLTGALNRRAFDAHLISLMKRNPQSPQLIGLAITDIDYFKKYNDFYGHLAGDAALRRVANALNNGLRNPTDHIYRVGGEEFAILIYINNPQDLPPIINRLVEEVAALGIPHEQSPTGHLTVSIGAVITKAETEPQLEKMYGVADNALYEAKAKGRNCWVII